MNFQDTVTAITLSAKPAACTYVGLSYLNPVQTIKSCSDYRDAFYGAITQVKTPYFFFLDDDDNVPDDYLSVLEDGLAKNAAVVYTDEVRRFKGEEVIYRPGEYAADKHLANPAMLHHLVLCQTSSAKNALNHMPKGQYWPEMPLYFDLAQDSAAYIPRIGYHWHRSDAGLSSTADIAIGQMRSRIWCGSLV